MLNQALERAQEVEHPDEITCPECGAHGHDLTTWPAASLDESWPYEEGKCKVCETKFRAVPIRCVVKKVE